MKKIIKVAFMAAIVAVTGYNMSQSQSVMNSMSDLALANVEALANGEQGTNCTGFYYVCQSNLASFLAEKKQNCDIDNVSYVVIDC